jgi:hypothetical protein
MRFRNHFGLQVFLPVLASTSLLWACSRVPAEQAEPVAVADVQTSDPLAGADAQTVDTSSDSGAKADSTATAAAGGGLWVVDANGAPVGILVQRGHPSLSLGAGLDILRDGAVVFSPATGLFFGVQMSSGAVINPRLGVADSTCAKPVVAGYYTEGNAISGQGYAFVFAGQWYRVQDYKPLELVTCGGTVADGVAGKCAPHSGTCRGFPVQAIAPGLPLQFAAPLQFSWVAK